jgi:phosphoribosylamine--glycine ligase
MGDPETEVVIPRIKSDLIELFEAVANGTLSDKNILVDERTAVTVMLVSGGYPEAYEKGKAIHGLDEVTESMIFHSGTTSADSDMIKTSGGRVLAVTSLGSNIKEASRKSYQSISKISFENIRYRSDIGKDLIS